jgi:flagella basal body P-ring formation protein FlgA
MIMNNRTIYRILISCIIFMSCFNFLFAGSSFSGERIKAACIEYVQNIVGQDAEVSLVQKVQDQNFEDTGISARCTGSAKTLRGYSTATVEFIKDDKLVKKLDVQLRVKIKKEVATATHTLQNGAIITGSDFCYRKADVTLINEDEIPDSSLLIGATIKKSIPKGAVITNSHIFESKPIHRGEKVTVLVKSGAVTIKAIGQAMQDAATGESIKVKCNEVVLQGRAAMDGTVVLLNN